MRCLRISTARATHQHQLGGHWHTIETWTAVLWSHHPHMAARETTTLAESAGLSEDGAIRLLVKGWRKKP